MMGGHPLSFAAFDFDQTPFLVIWETTQACPLACRHCRAEARENRDPGELTTEEGRRLLSEIRAMGTPVCVLSGGDPLRRPDLLELIRHGHELGLRMATIPAASEHLTRDTLVELKQAGLAQVAFSLDGSTAEIHDNFRQVPGTFARTLEGVRWAHEVGLPLQINSTFTADNLHDLEPLIALVSSLDIVFWEVFSLIPTGRGAVLRPMSAGQHERLFARLHALAQDAPFVIKVTEAPHYRRFVLQHRAKLEKLSPSDDPTGAPSGGQAASHPGRAATSAIPAQLSRDLSTRDSLGGGTRGINAAKGFCFVNHLGDVFPSGFLPLRAGNVRETPLADLYRDSDLFRQLRNPTRLKGRCGPCEYADVCGGSRARAYAVSGDAFAEDPACAYQPRPVNAGHDSIRKSTTP